MQQAEGTHGQWRCPVTWPQWGGRCAAWAKREEPPAARPGPSACTWPVPLTWAALGTSRRAVEAVAAVSLGPWEELTDRPSLLKVMQMKSLCLIFHLQAMSSSRGIIIMGEDTTTAFWDDHAGTFQRCPLMRDREPDQTFSLNRDLTGELEYGTKISHFFKYLSSLNSYFKNFGAIPQRSFILAWEENGLSFAHEVTICSYEAWANPADHRVHQVNPHRNTLLPKVWLRLPQRHCVIEEVWHPVGKDKERWGPKRVGCHSLCQALSLGLAAETWPMEDTTPPGRVVWVPGNNRGSLGPHRYRVLGWSVSGSHGWCLPSQFMWPWDPKCLVALWQDYFMTCFLKWKLFLGCGKLFEASALCLY